MLLSMSVHAGDKLSSKDKKISFAYDVGFEMNFDNRELYKSDFSTSMTIFGARLTPAVGLQHIQNDGTSHKIMAGIDVMKDFGSAAQNLSLFREI